MGYDYKCTMEEDGRIVSWTASIDTLRMTASGQYEAEINGRGTYFHVIAGRHKYGSFLCIPNHPIRKVDAVTVAAGISHLEKAAAVSG